MEESVCLGRAGGGRLLCGGVGVCFVVPQQSDVADDVLPLVRKQKVIATKNTEIWGTSL
jgi:hypothetical protein